EAGGGAVEVRDGGGQELVAEVAQGGVAVAEVAANAGQPASQAEADEQARQEERSGHGVGLLPDGAARHVTASRLPEATRTGGGGGGGGSPPAVGGRLGRKERRSWGSVLPVSSPPLPLPHHDGPSSPPP